MRSVILLLSAYSAASTSSTCGDVDADSSSLLQARSLVRTGSQEKTARSLLQSLQEIAGSLKTAESLAATNPVDVNSALGTANEALATMFPEFVQEHASAQHEVDIQVGEIEACHRSAAHGVAARAQSEQRVTNRRAASEQCDAVLATAIETEAEECDEWTSRAEELLSAGLPGCGASNAEQLYEVATSWRDWMSNEFASVELQRTECNEATTAVASQSETCAATTSAFEEAFCHDRESCHLHQSCYAHEVEVYEGLRVEIEAGAVARRLQFRTARQAQCLVGLIMQAMLTSTPITDASLTACDNVDVDDLNLAYPDLPEAPVACQAAQDNDPQCDPIPHVLTWTNGNAGEGIDLSNLQPADGSPAGCQCELVELQGDYSAGHIVRCDNCLDVHRSTEQNSCPSGWKIFSPRDKEDYDTIRASVDMSRHSGTLHQPNLIVDVTRSENGCGGCTGAAMNSNVEAQSSWRTSDGSPWWLRDEAFGEPNGDYHANCYLWLIEDRAGSPHFNDANCNYHSSSYLCQPIMHAPRESHQEWTMVVQYGNQGYTPTRDASGEPSESNSGFAKLSDAAINALPSGGDAGYDYYMLSSASATPDTRDTIILRVTGAFDDTNIVYGFSDWQVCNAATFEECTSWSVARGGSHGIDTYYPRATNNCDRWFTGYQNNAWCWPDRSSGKRCWATGNTCSLGSHAIRTDVKMYKKTA